MSYWELPYPSRRQPVLADNVVATSQPLATQAGMAMLARGGSAVDAAVAAAAALAIVEPTSNGIGSDLFAIVWDGGRLHGLNASGRSPAALDAARFVGHGPMPPRGWDTVVVPGAVSGWAALVERFGRLGLDAALGPAIRYARDGFAVSPVTAAAWADAAETFADAPDFAAFLVDGSAPRAGERFACPEQAVTLSAVARDGAGAFYGGETAERIAAHAAAAGAALDGDDLTAHCADWVAPLGLDWGEDRVWELPPNGQGVAALQALGLLARTDVLAHAPDSAEAVHLQAEAVKLAFADAHRHVADPGHMTLDAADLIGGDYLDTRATRIDPLRASDPAHGQPRPGGTVYLCAADASGCMVSLIQSNYDGFGAGVVVPGTGVSMSNRGRGFVTEAGHPNVVAGGKRPFHTIIPGFVTSAAQPVMAFGVMGGAMQPQGHLQMVLRTRSWGQNPQAAADAPRWRVDGNRRLLLERGVPSNVAEALAARGHEVITDAGSGRFGGAQLVARTPHGYVAASDPRKDGHAAGS